MSAQGYNAQGYKPLIQDEDKAGNQEKATEHLDVIQFAAPIHVVDAGDTNPQIRLTIMRLGHGQGECSFKYATMDGSAKAHEQYVPKSGEITLASGQEDAEIVIDIIDDPQWNATMEFSVILSDGVRCDFGMLKRARVKVIDSSVFPTDAFNDKKEQLIKGDFEGIGEFSIFFGFCKLCTTVPNIKPLTFLIMFFDQLKNAYKYMYLMLSIYMVDRVFNFKDTHTEDLLIPGNRLYTAYVVAGLIITPVFFFFALDHLVVKLNVGGKLRTWLAKSLFRKYMNYSSDSQAAVALADQVGALTGDVNDACEGYLTLISVGRLVGKIGMSIFFTLQQNPDAWWAVVAIPSIMLVWAMCRTRPYIKVLDEADDVDDDRTAFVNESLSKLPLITSYNQRPLINQLFAKKCEDLGKKLVPQKQVVLTNKFLPEALGPLFVAIYVAIGAELVLNGELKLGVYLATISVFGDICGAFSEMFGMAMSIISTFTGLKGLTNHLNMPTDLLGLKEAYWQKEQTTTAKRKEIVRKDGDHTPRVDLLPIEIENLSFDTDDLLLAAGGGLGKKPLFKDMSFIAPQGKIIAIIGRSGSGRRSFLELLCMRKFADKGNVFIPAHLRNVLVTRELYLLNLSLWENLVFGNKEGNDPYRVENILRYFGLEQVITLCEEELKKRKAEFDNPPKEATATAPADEEEEDEKGLKENPMDKLRESEKAFIHLARAYVMNPEVIVMHRPFANFHGDTNLGRVKQSMIDHRDCRGLFMDPKTAHRRRPRTLIYSSDNKAAIAATADIIWSLPSKVGERGSQHDKIDEAILTKLDEGGL